MLVRRKENTQLYAMKVLKKKQIIQENQVGGTKSERSILSTIDHPFIVKLHRSFQDAQKLYLVIEYCPGGDMFECLKKFGKFPEEHARFYGAEVLLAVEELHKNLVLYRDLKPENVLLDEAGHVRLA